ncbi:hypothetical protein [Bradyrhizobium sp. URHC0002]
MSARTRAGTGAFGRAAVGQVHVLSLPGAVCGRMRVGADYHRDDVPDDPAKNVTKVGFGGSGRSGIREREPVARNFLPHREEISAPHVSTIRLRLQK